MNNKKIIISFFIASLFLSVLIQTSKLVNYALNQDEYTAQFCENKDVPESNCKGSCHLSKELKLSSNDLPNQTNEITVGLFTIFSFQQLVTVEQPFIMIKETEHNFSYKLISQDTFIDSIFRPPIA